LHTFLFIAVTAALLPLCLF